MKQDLEKDHTVRPKGSAHSSKEGGESLSPPDLVTSLDATFADKMPDS